MNGLTSPCDRFHSDDLHSHELEFRARHPWVWRLTLFGPFLFSTLLVLLLWAQIGWEFTSKIITVAVMTVFFFGQFIILSGTEGGFQDTSGSLSASHLFAVVTYLDVMTAIVMAFHIGFLFRLPFVGTRISALVTDGHFILDAQPWMRKATMIGLIAFVGCPLAATGSVGGSIVGRLLGLSRVGTFVGILIGALLGNSIMFGCSDLLNEVLDKNNLYLQLAGIAAVAGLIIVLERRYRKLRDGFVTQTFDNAVDASIRTTATVPFTTTPTFTAPLTPAPAPSPADRRSVNIGHPPAHDPSR